MITKKIRSNSTRIESLESRTYYDLVPLAVAALPTSVIATTKTTGTISVALTNTGTTTIKGPYTLELFASPDGSLNDATPIVTLNENLAPLAANKTRTLHAALGTFPMVATGNYNILAQVTGPLTGADDNIVASTAQIAVTDPSIDLTATFSSNGPTSLKPGQTIIDIITVTNQGNIPAKGALEIDLASSPNSDGSNATQFTTLTETINLAPGKHQAFHFPFVIPSTIPPGTYYGVVNIDPSNTFNEADITNNTAVTQGALTVLSAYPNIVGSLTGNYDFSAGQDKGTTGTLNIVVTSEDPATGDVTGTGTSSNGADFTFTGTITPQGVVNLATDIPGGNNTLTGRFANGILTGIINLPSKDSTGDFSISLASVGAHRPGPHR